jgi:molybdopterin synthase sulfur carrier subunit
LSSNDFGVLEGHNNFMITVLYFARLREALGQSSEQVPLPAAVRDLEGLRALLVARGGAWEQELAPSKPVRAAVNQAMAHGDTRIADGDEVAFFPPVTGG